MRDLRLLGCASPRPPSPQQNQGKEFLGFSCNKPEFVRVENRKGRSAKSDDCMGKFGGEDDPNTLAEAQESRTALEPQAGLRAAAEHLSSGSKLAWPLRSWALPVASCVVPLGFF